MAGILSIEKAFGELKDPRSRAPVHDLNERLVVALCAILAGADSWLGIELWAQAKSEWLRRHTPLKNGVPSHDTFGRVFSALNPKQFEACFLHWMSHACPALAGQVVAIDGKTVRRSYRRGERAIHLVSAYSSGLGLVLGQVRTSEKSNEITAIPELLEALLLQGAIVTLDAMGCQRGIAQKIVKAGADYVLSVKEKQSTPLTRIRAALDAIERVPGAYADCTSEYREVEKGHGRIETRRCIASSALTNWQPEPELWPGLRAIAMVESTREIGDAVATQRRYYVSSVPPDAARIAHAVRSHGAIENGMHWTLDVAFNEDQCRARVEHAGVCWIEVGGDPEFIDRVAFEVRAFDWSGPPFVDKHLTLTRHPAMTSFGPVSMQLRTAAQTLGMDPLKVSASQFRGLSDRLQRDIFNIDLVARHLRQLAERDGFEFPFSVDQLRIIGARYNRGSGLSLEQIRQNTSYGDFIVKHWQRFVRLMH
ncbi:ISAs1 family transposase [Burkholderia latens]|nr:ISAs1 family transposase [Burkholderia latens]KAB0636382.1 ISAs1 family transposase [Burkholderia latens]